MENNKDESLDLSNKGDKKDYWSVSVNGNWRVIFRFKNENAYDVDYIDYH